LEEDVLVPHGVVPASYHGGDFNGVSCRAFMGNSEEIFITGGEKSSDSLQSCLLAVDPTKRCPDSEILKMTKIYSVLFRLMDGFFSIMRCPFGKATPEDTESLQTLLQKMIPIWKKLDLPETPKWHATVEHAINQFHRLKGYGEAQEDFIEFFHQEGNNELNRFRCIKDYKKKTKCILNAAIGRDNIGVQEKRRMVKDSIQTRKRKSTERIEIGDSKQVKRAKAVEEAANISPTKLISLSDRLVDDYKEKHNIN